MRQKLHEIEERFDQLLYYKQQYPHIWEEFYKKFTLSWIYHENILDGFALTPEEIEEALATDITRDISLISVYRRIRNYRNCINHIEKYTKQAKLTFTPELVAEIHAILVESMDIPPGQYRKNSPVHRAYYQTICSPKKIPQHVSSILNSINSELQQSTTHPLRHLANIHHHFMMAYPFSSWSGIVVRFITNIIVQRHGLLPIVIHCKDRQKYYHAVATSPDALYNVFLESLENNLDNAEHHFISNCLTTTPIKRYG